MKRISIYLISLLILITAFSCNEDILDVKPKDALSEDLVFNDDVLLSAYVQGIYSGIDQIFQSNAIGTECMTDMAVGWKGNYLKGRVNPTTGEGVTHNLWKDMYKYIRDCNTFMERTEETEVSPDVLQKLTGEVKFLRAYFYFDLVRTYGGVPLITERLELDDAGKEFKRSSSDEVFDFVVTECDQAAGMLPADGPGSKATSAAALALKAKALLYKASPLFNPENKQDRWDAAAKANKVVIDLPTHQLHSVYSEIFLPPIVDEILLCIEYNETRDQGNWAGANVALWPNGNYGWSQCRPTAKFVNMFPMKDGKIPFNEDGSINLESGIDPNNPYDNRDPRLSDIVLYNGADFKGRKCEYWYTYDVDGEGHPSGRAKTGGGLDTNSSPIEPWNASGTGYNYKKLTDPSKDVFINGSRAASFSPDIKMRMTEFYLNYAETQIQLGNEDEARAAINVVRSRASVGMPAISETLTGEQLLKEYRRERAIELALEDQRWHDIRRWKICDEVLDKNPRWGVWVEKLSNGEYRYSHNRGGSVENTQNIWNPSHYLIPIPQSEIDASNHALEQNPGYD